MAYTTINKSTDYFRTKIYSGDGTSNRAITWDESPNMSTDFGWLKERTNDTASHLLMDVIRGNGNIIFANTDSSEQAYGDNYFKSLDANGFTVGNDEDVNSSDDTYVVWGWNAGGTGSSNTDGSITSTVSANTTAGFSIVSYTGTGANATVGHGLGTAPSMIIQKNRDSVLNWKVYHKSLGATKYMNLDQTNAAATASTIWNDTEPTTSVYSLGTGNTNNSGEDYIAYCFAEKKGFSKFGKYNGNGNADGTFIFCGFKPTFIITKRSDAIDWWSIRDIKRDALNPNQAQLEISSAVESTSAPDVDFLSNGFKMRNVNNGMNNASGTYIYMAFGQSLVGSNDIPCTAR